MAQAVASLSAEVVTNIAFGMVAAMLSLISVWQGRHLWATWREQHNVHEHHPGMFSI